MAKWSINKGATVTDGGKVTFPDSPKDESYTLTYVSDDGCTKTKEIVAKGKCKCANSEFKIPNTAYTISSTGGLINVKYDALCGNFDSAKIDDGEYVNEENKQVTFKINQNTGTDERELKGQITLKTGTELCTRDFKVTQDIKPCECSTIKSNIMEFDSVSNVWDADSKSAYTVTITASCGTITGELGGADGSSFSMTTAGTETNMSFTISPKTANSEMESKEGVLTVYLSDGNEKCDQVDIDLTHSGAVCKCDTIMSNLEEYSVATRVWNADDTSDYTITIFVSCGTVTGKLGDTDSSSFTLTTAGTETNKTFTVKPNAVNTGMEPKEGVLTITINDGKDDCGHVDIGLIHSGVGCICDTIKSNIGEFDSASNVWPADSTSAYTVTITASCGTITGELGGTDGSEFSLTTAGTETNMTFTIVPNGTNNETVSLEGVLTVYLSDGNGNCEQVDIDLTQSAVGCNCDTIESNIMEFDATSNVWAADSTTAYSVTITASCGIITGELGGAAGNSFTLTTAGTETNMEFTVTPNGVNDETTSLEGVLTIYINDENGNCGDLQVDIDLTQSGVGCMCDTIESNIYDYDDDMNLWPADSTSAYTVTITASCGTIIGELVGTDSDSFSLTTAGTMTDMTFTVTPNGVNEGIEVLESTLIITLNDAKGYCYSVDIDLAHIATECDCSDEVMRSLIIPLNTYFENNDGGRYKIAQYHKMCGKLKVEVFDCNMIENHELEIVDDETDKSIKYVYANITKNNDISRSCALNFNLYTTDSKRPCVSAKVELHQGEQYYKCGEFPRPSHTNLSSDYDLIVSDSSYAYSMLAGKVGSGTFVFNGKDNKGSISVSNDTKYIILPVKARIASGYAHSNVRASLVEIGYFNNISKETILFDNAIIRCFDVIKIDEADINVLSKNENEIAKWCSSATDDLGQVTITINNVDSSHKYNYVKVSYDFYTQYDDKFPNSGIKCSNLLEYYVLLDNNTCPNCLTRYGFYNLIDNYSSDGGIYHVELRKDARGTLYNFVCDADVTDVWVASDSSNSSDSSFARVQEGSIKRENGSIVEFDIEIDPNNDANETDDERKLYIFCSTKIDGITNTCDNLIYALAQKKCTGCQDIYKLINFGNYKKVKDLGDIDFCSYNGANVHNEKIKSESDLADKYNNAFNLNLASTDAVARWLVDKPSCLKALFVLCDKDGNDIELKPGELTDTICKDAKSKIGYYSSMLTDVITNSNGIVIGQEMDTIFNWYIRVLFESADSTYKQTIPIFTFYRIKIFRNGDYTEPICQSDVHFFSYKQTYSYEDCIKPSGSNIDGYSVVSLNRVSGVKYGEDDEIIFPRTGGTITAFTLNYANDEEMGDPICPGYKTHYSLNIGQNAIDENNTMVRGKEVIISLKGIETGNEDNLHVTMNLNCQVSNGEGNAVTRTTTIRMTWENTN